MQELEKERFEHNDLKKQKVQTLGKLSKDIEKN